MLAQTGIRPTKAGRIGVNSAGQSLMSPSNSAALYVRDLSLILRFDELQLANLWRTESWPMGGGFLDSQYGPANLEDIEVVTDSGSIIFL